jgi:hypothetical protein
MFGERQRACNVIASGTCACGWVLDRVFRDTEVGEVIHADDALLDRGWLPRAVVFNVYGCAM